MLRAGLPWISAEESDLVLPVPCCVYFEGFAAVRTGFGSGFGSCFDFAVGCSFFTDCLSFWDLTFSLGRFSLERAESLTLAGFWTFGWLKMATARGLFYDTCCLDCYFYSRDSSFCGTSTFRASGSADSFFSMTRRRVLTLGSSSRLASLLERSGSLPSSPLLTVRWLSSGFSSDRWDSRDSISMSPLPRLCTDLESCLVETRSCSNTG